MKKFIMKNNRSPGFHENAEEKKEKEKEKEKTMKNQLK
jgi:hypothetical protein